jgi:hypothetical protein
MSFRDLPGRARERVQSAWSHRPAWLFTWPTLAVVALLVIGWLWLGDLFGERTTLGTIVVGSPAIYTRERLVNDRFLQDAWLSNQLEPESGIHDSLGIRTESRAGAVRAGPAKEPAAAPGNPGPPATGGPQPRLSSRARLLEEVDYREVVRSLLIENQLDDRHDLNGNSLYRFKFEASVLPGTNTQAGALIQVRLISPPFLASGPGKHNLKSLASLGSLEDIALWRTIYSGWIENLRARLNQTHTELKQGFHNNEFSHNDYAHLIAFLSRNLNVGVKEVCPAQFEDVRGPETLGMPLSTEEHGARKRCIAAMVERTIPRKVVVTPLGDAPIGTYLVDPKGERPAESDDTNRARKIHDTVEAWLNSFFAGKTVKLVLGLAVPEANFFQARFNDIPAFKNLVRLTFFNGNPDAIEGRVFDVNEKVFSVAAFDPGRITQPEMTKIFQPGGLLAGHAPDDFGPLDPARPGRLRVSRRTLDSLKDDVREFSEEEFMDASSGQGVYAASAEVGLLNFVRAARKNALSFTYGVTPKESADSVDVTLSADARVEGQTPDKSEAGAAQLRREATSRTLQRRTTVVGFAGVPSKNPRDAEFGWLISPRLIGLDGMRQAYVQTPAQYSLSALLSIPAWWNKAQFVVSTSWVGKAGRVIARQAPIEYVVDLPTDFEPLEALLLGTDRLGLGPELMEFRLDSIALTACQPGAIVIPGRRLWRSTKVTLGYQTADSISVLPNMKGIIAKFDRVQNPITRDEDAALRKKGGDGGEIHRPVRVWTSQGSLTLPQPATIGVPAGTPVNCAPPPAPKPEGGAEPAATKK